MNTTSPADTTMRVLTTVVTLDAEHPAARAIVLDGHMAHRLTMSGFAHLLQKYDFFTGISGGHADHRRSLNVLFATSARPDGRLVLRIQSDKAPDFSHVACEYWRGAIDTSSPPVTRQWPIPATGDIRYQIRANPSLTTNGRRRAINGTAQRVRWWTDKAAAAGLALWPETVTIDDPVTIEFPSKYRGAPVDGRPRWMLATQRYSGAATITDPEAYRSAIQRGIGRGLSYGAGLLLTKPAN
jgi:hypothetical protein